jgi:hypothetical protein
VFIAWCGNASIACRDWSWFCLLVAQLFLQS